MKYPDLGSHSIKSPTSYFGRINSDRIQTVAATFPALVLTGARQSGKTTLLRDCFPSHHYVTLDLPSAAERAERDPEAFLSAHPPPVIIDEIQYAPGLFRHLKVAIDRDRHAFGQFILTGSQKFPLMKEVSDSLAGRCAWLELEGFALSEVTSTYPQAPELNNDFWLNLIYRGGFPELWRNPELLPQDFYSSYLATYLERDVRQLLNVGSLRDFERFIRACAARNGQLLDKSSLGRDVGVTAKTINSWLSVLVASNQIALLEPWFANVGKRVIKSPKLYFCDTGLCSFLLGLTATTLATSPFIGELWETLVYGEIRKQMMARRLPGQLWFYRDESQLEVDFLYLAGGHGDVVEAKWLPWPGPGEAKGVRELMKLAERKKPAELSRATGWIICRTEEPFPVAGDGPEVKALGLNHLIGDVFRHPFGPTDP